PTSCSLTTLDRQRFERFLVMWNRIAAYAAAAAGLAQVRHEDERVVCGRKARRENHAGGVTEIEIQVKAAASTLIGELISATKRGFTSAEPGKLPRKADRRPEVVEVFLPKSLVRIRRIRSNELKRRQRAVL